MASNPVTVDLTEDTWTRVAQNVTSGGIFVISEAPRKYVQTFRLTGAVAPTTVADAGPFIGRYMPISSDQPIDVYMMAIGGNGKVRADL